MEQVKKSAAWVAVRSTHVTVDSSALEKLVDKLEGSLPQVNWDFEGIYYFDNGTLTVQYLLVPDALNFCFWPAKEQTLEDLWRTYELVVEEKGLLLDNQLRNSLLYLGLQNVQIMVGIELGRSFGGKGINLVERSGKSSVTLVDLHAISQASEIIRCTKVTRFSSTRGHMAKAIDSDYEISPGSEQEVEIRACSIYVVEKVKD